MVYLGVYGYRAMPEGYWPPWVPSDHGYPPVDHRGIVHFYGIIDGFGMFRDMATSEIMDHSVQNRYRTLPNNPRFGQPVPYDAVLWCIMAIFDHSVQ